MDLRADNPVGRIPDPTRTVSKTLQVSPEGWSLGRRKGGWDGSIFGVLDRLDRAHSVEVVGASLIESSEAPRLGEWVHKVAARGTLVTGQIDPEILHGLPAALVGQIPAMPLDSAAGLLDWDVAAGVQRREAIKPLLESLPTVSAVLMTRRPELVVPMLDQLARQTYPNLEIVVALHGVAAPSELVNVTHERGIQLVSIDGDAIFGAGLQQAFELAGGELVTKIDDDDFYAPEHIYDLVLAKAYSGATVVGKSQTVIYLQQLDTTVRRVLETNELFVERLPGGAMLFSAADLRSAGGWPHVPHGVDTELNKKFQAAGGTLYKPNDLGYLYVRHAAEGSHTWTIDESHFLRAAPEQWVGLLQHAEFGTQGVTLDRKGYSD